MLTEKQKRLFVLLDYDVNSEDALRERHKMLVTEFGAVKDFTRWLQKILEHRWREDRRRNSTPYLGD
jgi:hypothetical protein